MRSGDAIFMRASKLGYFHMCSTSFGCPASPSRIPTIFEYFSRTGMMSLNSAAQARAVPTSARVADAEMRV
jgi:hypothetical protein